MSSGISQVLFPTHSTQQALATGLWLESLKTFKRCANKWNLHPQILAYSLARSSPSLQVWAGTCAGLVTQAYMNFRTSPHWQFQWHAEPDSKSSLFDVGHLLPLECSLARRPDLHFFPFTWDRKTINANFYPNRMEAGLKCVLRQIVMHPTPFFPQS